MTNKTPRTRKPKATKAQVRKALSCTLKLFADPSRFTVGKWSVDADGNRVDIPKSPKSCAWCLEGGLMKCSPDFPPRGNNVKHSPIYDATVDVLQPIVKAKFGYHDLYAVNDRKGYDAVIELLEDGLAKLAPKAKVT